MSVLRLFILLSFLYVSAEMVAQEKSIVMESSNDTLLYGNYFELTITLNNVEADLPSMYFDHFTITSGPNISSQYQSINGAVRQSKSYSYYLEADEEGVFTIPPVEIETANDLITSNPISIVVSPNPDGIITTPERKQQSFFFDWFSPMQEFPDTPTKPTPPAKPDPLKKKRKKI